MTATSHVLLLLLSFSGISLVAGCTLANGEPPDDIPDRDTTLDLVLEVSTGGEVRLVAASDLEGGAAVSDLPKGDYAVEVTRSGATLWVESLGDPFEVHSFGGPGQQDHHFETQEWGTVHLRVPGANRERIDPDLVIRLLRIEEAGTVTRVNAETLAALAEEGRLEEVARLTGGELQGLLNRPPTGD